MTKRNTVIQAWIFILILISSCLLMPRLTMAGNLEPSAAPAPTMKTLDQVEPRIAIPGSTTPAAVYTITQSGSYYLAGNRICSGGGIVVNTSNVTIDLMGYSLFGPGTGTDNGIYMAGYKNVEIRNGTVRGFNIGIVEAYSTGRGHRIIKVRAIANRESGIVLYSSDSVVKDCTVRENGSSASNTVYGIFVNSGSLVINNIVSENGSSATGIVSAIECSVGSMVVNNIVNQNGLTAGSNVYGIFISEGTVINNTVYYNGSGATGTVYSINAGSYSKVSGNTINNNGYANSGIVYGINCSYGCTVTDNTSADNGIYGSGTAYGIHLEGDCMVDQNTAFNHDTNMTGSGTCTTCTFGTNHAP